MGKDYWDRVIGTNLGGTFLCTKHVLLHLDAQRSGHIIDLHGSGGKTDREIAEALFVSARTVGGHVSNILNKTNTANRTEAASYATRHGLVRE